MYNVWFITQNQHSAPYAKIDEMINVDFTQGSIWKLFMKNKIMEMHNCVDTMSPAGAFANIHGGLRLCCSSID